MTRFARRGLIHAPLQCTCRFCHHLIATPLNKPCMCVYHCQQFISLLFPRLVSGACQTSTSARIVFNWLCWLLTKSHWPVCCHTTSQYVFHWFGYFWGYLQHPWVHMEMSILDVSFYPSLVVLEWWAIQLASHWIVHQLPCITVEWWRIAWKKLYAFSRHTAFNISNWYFVIAFTSPFWQIRSHIWPGLWKSTMSAQITPS